MKTCQHLYKTGIHNTLTCNDCGEVFTAEGLPVGRRKRKKPLPAKDIRYWYQVPVRIKYQSAIPGEGVCC
jgi:hypothetical protein